MSIYNEYGAVKHEINEMVYEISKKAWESILEKTKGMPIEDIRCIAHHLTGDILCHESDTVLRFAMEKRRKEQTIIRKEHDRIVENIEEANFGGKEETPRKRLPQDERGWDPNEDGCGA